MEMVFGVIFLAVMVAFYISWFVAAYFILRDLIDSFK